MKKILIGLMLLFLGLFLIPGQIQAALPELKMAVSPSISNNNINATINDLNLKADQLVVEDIFNDEKLKDYQVLFINNDPSLLASGQDPISLAKFASNGGYICFFGESYELLNKAFPEVILASANKESETKEVKIIDKGLANYLGNDKSKIKFSANWMKIKNSGAKVKTYVEADSNPLIAGFDYGEGGIIFSSIIPGQTENESKNILKWLVLRSRNFKIISQNSKILRDANLVPNDEILASFDEKEILKYTILAFTSADIRFAAAIPAGEVIISVFSDGKKLDEVDLSVNDSPSIIELQPQSSFFSTAQAAEKKQFSLEVESKSADTNLAVITLSNSIELSSLFVRESLAGSQETVAKPNIWQSLKPYYVFVVLGLIGFIGLLILVIVLTKSKKEDKPSNNPEFF